MDEGRSIAGRKPTDKTKLDLILIAIAVIAFCCVICGMGLILLTRFCVLDWAWYCR